jgi:hypothetical protein
MRNYIFILLSLAISMVTLVGAQVTNEIVAVTTDAVLLCPEGRTNLIIRGDGQFFEISWQYPPPLKGGMAIKEGEIYTFSVLVHQESGTRWGEVIRIVQNGTNLYDREICELHNLRMDLRETPIRYGLPDPKFAVPFAQARPSLFPHGADFEWGGCVVVVGEDKRKTQMLYRCSECVKAYNKWKR